MANYAFSGVVAAGDPRLLLRSHSPNELPAGTWTEITPAAYDAAALIPEHHRNWNGSAVVEMSGGEKAASDAARLSNNRDAVADEVDDPESKLRASLLSILDESNLQALKINAILDAIDGATSLATVKSAIAAIPDMPTRTIAKMKTDIRGNLGS